MRFPEIYSAWGFKLLPCRVYEMPRLKVWWWLWWVFDFEPNCEE